MTNLVIKENPNAELDFLRFQVGLTESRPLQLPLFAELSDGVETYRIIGYEDAKYERVQIFHLKGFGPTLKEAQAMAGMANVAADKEQVSA